MNLIVMFFKWLVARLEGVKISDSISTGTLTRVDGKNDTKTFDIEDWSHEEIEEFLDTEAYRVVTGEAKDGETIIRLRPKIEEQVIEEEGKNLFTELYWNMKSDGTFWYQLHFYDCLEDEDESDEED